MVTPAKKKVRLTVPIKGTRSALPEEALRGRFRWFGFDGLPTKISAESLCYIISLHSSCGCDLPPAFMPNGFLNK